MSFVCYQVCVIFLQCWYGFYDLDVQDCEVVLRYVVVKQLEQIICCSRLEGIRKRMEKRRGWFGVEEGIVYDCLEFYYNCDEVIGGIELQGMGRQVLSF